MSEKVLGFKERDALYDNGDALVKGWTIDEEKLVPVVSLEALKEFSRKQQKKMYPDINVEDLLSWAKKQSKGKGEKK